MAIRLPSSVRVSLIAWKPSMTKIRGLPPGSLRRPGCFRPAGSLRTSKAISGGASSVRCLAAAGWAWPAAPWPSGPRRRTAYRLLFRISLNCCWNSSQRLLGEVLAGQQPFQLAGRRRGGGRNVANDAILEDALGVDEKRGRQRRDLQPLAGLDAGIAEQRQRDLQLLGRFLDGLRRRVRWSRFTAQNGQLCRCP